MHSAAAMALTPQRLRAKVLYLGICYAKSEKNAGGQL